jgi:hypothetical protein
VDTVIGFLKQKLPPELSGQLESLLSGQESSSGIMDAGRLVALSARIAAVSNGR